MDIRKVKKLIELLEESKISEIEIHEGEESVRISRAAAMPQQTVMHVPAGSEAMTHPGQGDAVTSRGMEESTATERTGHVVKSPMVGTFYASSTPGGPALVEVGQTVEAGDVLCIIEAMKIMNQIEADVSGVIREVLVENGDPVEYGQPLFIID